MSAKISRQKFLSAKRYAVCVIPASEPWRASARIAARIAALSEKGYTKRHINNKQKFYAVTENKKLDKQNAKKYNVIVSIIQIRKSNFN